MNLLDLWFSRFRFYRQWRGGDWFKVGPGPAQPYIDPFWIKGPARLFERIYETEINF